MSDDELLAAVVSSAGSRLSNPQLVRSGTRFLLASATHAPSGKLVLLTVSKPDFGHGVEQLALVRKLLAAANNARLGEVIDRFWSSDQKRGEPIWGCLVSTWHPSAAPLTEALVEGSGSASSFNVLNSLSSVFKQVRAIHRAGFVHGDISMSNILVAAAGTTHLIDFEYVNDGKFLIGDQLFLTEGYSHPSRLAMLESGSYSMEDSRQWDRYALGRLVLETISDANPYDFPELTLYTQRALRLVGGLLLGAAIRPSEVAMGLPPEFFRDEAYQDLDAPIEALGRLRGIAPPEFAVPELAAVPTSVVEAGLLRPVPFTARVRRILETPQMESIASCMQLGLINFIWPTATHTRVEHAIGTFGMACSAVVELTADPQSPFFRVMIGPRLIRTLIAAALLHDVGHYPLAHDFEEAVPGPFEHESRSVRFIVSAPIADILRAPETADDSCGWAVEPADVASVIAGEQQPGSEMSSWMCDLLHSVISGALDVDKLDYLVRDSGILGVAAGAGIDVQRVLSSLTISLVPNDRGKPGPVPDHLQMAVRAKGIRPAELVGRIRSHMFGVVYWHRSYRSIKAMIHWIVWTAVVRDGSSADAVRRRSLAVAEELFAALDVADAVGNGAAPMLPGFAELAIAPGRIPPREGAVLSFMAAAGDEDARMMLEVLASKRWYKSIFTVEHFDNVAAMLGHEEIHHRQLWETIRDELYDQAAERQIPLRMKLAQLVQQGIADWLAPRTEGAVSTRVIDWDSMRDQFLVASRSAQLILVDLVETRKSADSPLYFAVNEKPGSRLADTSKPIMVRRSFDQKQLVSEFVISNGAIRVLCHPDFQSFIDDSIPPEQLLQILVGAVGEVLPRAKPRRARTRS